MPAIPTAIHQCKPLLLNQFLGVAEMLLEYIQ